jgi:drug/metabolite transporter (DMT)-like permease
MTVLLTAYVAQLFGAWLALRGIGWGGRIIALVGAVWVVGALLIHGPEIRVDGLHWRSGALSIAGVILVIVAGAFATWYGALASQSSSRSA